MIKSPHAKSTPFSPEVCNAIRHHLGEIAALESKRDIAFEDRDHASEDLAKHHAAVALGEPDGLSIDEVTQYKSQHSDAVREIDELKDAIKFHNAELARTVKNADTPGLEVMLERPLPPPTLKKPDSDADAPGQLVLGEDSPSGQGLGSQEKGDQGKDDGDVLQPDFHIPAGVDQHLQASVRELQLDEKITNRLIELGFITIGRVAALLDSGAMLDDCGMTGPQASTVTAAVNKYRAVHRKAMHEVELGGDQPAAGVGGGVPHDQAGGRGAEKAAKKAAGKPTEKPGKKAGPKSGRKAAAS
jgi:hypothetical protein